MLKEITLNAEPELLRQAMLVAQHRQTTLEAEFRQWLNRYIVQNQLGDHYQRGDHYIRLMKELSHVQVGRTFTRDELNV